MNSIPDRSINFNASLTYDDDWFSSIRDQNLAYRTPNIICFNTCLTNNETNEFNFYPQSLPHNIKNRLMNQAPDHISMHVFKFQPKIIPKFFFIFVFIFLFVT